MAKEHNAVHFGESLKDGGLNSMEGLCVVFNNNILYHLVSCRNHVS